MPAFRRKSPLRRLLSATALALLVHAALGGVALVAGPPRWFVPLPAAAEPGPADDGDGAPLQIEALVQELDQPARLTAEEQKAKQEEEQVRPEGQVVDIARPPVEQRPDNARFLAEYDSLVKKETRGPSGKDQAGAKLPEVAMEAPRPRPAQAQQAGGAQPLPPGRPGAPGSHASPAATLEGLRHFAPDGTLGRPQPESAAGLGGQRGGPPSRLNLAATPEMLQRALSAGSGSVDALPDLDEGDSTSLSAKKWVYATFFNRVKREVAAQWHPDTVSLRHDPSGNVYGVKDQVTVLRVHLNGEGELVDLQVAQRSGVEFLDEEAMEAFRRAQPFPNPPTKLLEADGQIHFKFGFIVERSGRTSFKVFRYPQ